MNDDLRNEFDDVASQTNKAFSHVRQVHGRTGGDNTQGEHDDGDVRLEFFYTLIWIKTQVNVLARYPHICLFDLPESRPLPAVSRRK